MKKITMLLFPIAIFLALISFLHLSYVINYLNIDETIIGLILLLISNCICLFYIYRFSKRKKIDYIIFSIVSLFLKNSINSLKSTPLSFPPTNIVFTFTSAFTALIVDAGIVAIESL